MKKRQPQRADTIRGLGIGVLSLALIGWVSSVSGNEPGKEPKDPKTDQAQVQAQASQDAASQDQAANQNPANPDQNTAQDKAGQTKQQTQPGATAPETSVQESQTLNRAETDTTREARQKMYTEKHFLLTENLIGLEVRDQQGEDIGDVHDILVDGQKEKAPLIVVSLGGLFGIGDDLYAIPWEEVAHNHEDNACVLQIPKHPEGAATAPTSWIALEESFDEDQPKFGQGPYGMKPLGEDETRVQSPPADTAQLVSANELLDKDVQSKTTNEEIGSLENLIVGSTNGDLVAAVFSVETADPNLSPAARVDKPGVRDPGVADLDNYEDKEIAVPMTLVQLDDAEQVLIAEISTDEIANSPDIDDIEQDDKVGIDRSWVENVYRQFNEDINQLGVEMTAPEPVRGTR